MAQPTKKRLEKGMLGRHSASKLICCPLPKINFLNVTVELAHFSSSLIEIFVNLKIKRKSKKKIYVLLNMCGIRLVL